MLVGNLRAVSEALTHGLACPSAKSLTADAGGYGPFVVEARVLPVYVVLAVPPTLAGVAVVIAAIRAKQDDLPDIVRALMRIGPRDGNHADGDADRRDTPPSLPES